MEVTERRRTSHKHTSNALVDLLPEIRLALGGEHLGVGHGRRKCNDFGVFSWLTAKLPNGMRRIETSKSTERHKHAHVL
jgi:hypothetical protein